MKLYLQRHCEPFPGPPMDPTRKLTEEGQRQAGEMAAFMVKQIGRVDIVITSPFARAMETAVIMAKSLGSHVADSKMLEPDGTPPEMWAEITRLAQQSREVLIIGHDPSINALMAWLMGFKGSTMFDPPLKDTNVHKFDGIRFDHGEIAHLKVKGDHTGKLHWFATVGMVERDEQEQEVIEAAHELLAVL